jgi:hypothetical protein
MDKLQSANWQNYSTSEINGTLKKNLVWEVKMRKVEKMDIKKAIETRIISSTNGN